MDGIDERRISTPWGMIIMRKKVGQGVGSLDMELPDHLPDELVDMVAQLISATIELGPGKARVTNADVTYAVADPMVAN